MKVSKLVLVVATLLAVSTGYAKDKHKSHDHDSHQAKMATPKLQLNNGKKWATDAPLRKNMQAIHDHLEPNLGKIHKGTLDSKGFAKLGGEISVNVDQIFKNCKLPPKADAQLHTVLADIIKGKDVFLAKHSADEYHDGAKKILGAYQSYLKYFDHTSAK